MQCSVTHKDPRCIAGATLLAGAISYLMGENVDLANSYEVLHFIEHLAHSIQNDFPEVADQLSFLQKSILMAPAEAAKLLG